MAHLKTRWCLAAAAFAAAALAGCHDNHHDNGTSQPTVGSTPLVFSTFVKQIYGNGANTTPINLDGLTFTFDVDDDPTAFDGLLM